ncbi:MAG: chromosome segregation protein SMC [Firmicutes bacterium]|nr:chromosome segregation protein SMC [Bacillota bacterium]
MHIKRLELKGFKSFADKTELELADGITAVVGPNGSGKSNLADAIKWVLGEQSVKALRGSRMDELIFAGTEARRGVGLAEVSLIFDNESGRFPLAFNEIAVTRRLFKSGESEYYINQTKCRLRDIQDLFLDTGIGKDAYSFIGQGRIDELLSVKPEDRRAIFEEVAGIAKYKARKRETENKLKDAQAALTRTQDLLYELEAEQEPLEEEAARAREYLRLEAAIKSAEKDLLLYELNMLERRRERDSRQKEDLQDKNHQQQAELLQLEALEESLRLQTATLQEDLEKANQALLTAARKREQLGSEQRLLASRQEDRQAHWALLQSRKAELLANEADQAREEQACLADLSSIAQAKAEHEAAISTCQDQLQNLSDSHLIQQLEQERAALEQLAAARSAAELNLGVWHDRRTRLQNELSTLRQQQLESENRYRSLQADANQAAAARQRANDKLQQLAEELRRLEHDRTAAQEQLATAQDEKRRLQQEIAVAKNRASLLRELINSQEGYQYGVRNLLQAKRRGEKTLQGIVGAVGDLLRVSPRYETAIEAALGGSVQFLVAETEQDAQRGINWLKANKKGRATFLPLNVVAPRQRRSVDLEAVGQPGALGFAADLIEYDPYLDRVVHHLLGNIVIVETLEQAFEIARRTSHQVRMVTLEGDVLMPGGSITGGSRQQRGSGLLGRQRQLVQLDARLRKLDGLLTGQEAEVELRQDRLAQVQAALQKQERELNEQAEILRQTEALLAAAERAQAEQEQRLHEGEQALQALSSKLEESQAAYREAEVQLEAAIEAYAQQEESLRALQQATAGRDEQRQALAAELHQAELNLARLREQEASRIRELDGIRSRLREIQAAIQSVVAEQETLAQQTEQDSLELDKLEKAIAVQAGAERTWQGQVASLKETIVQANQRLLEMRNQIRAAREALEASKTQLYNVELRLSRLDADWEGLLKRLQRDFGVEDRQGLHSTLSSRTQGEERLSRLQEELLELGPVRVGALQELERLNQRIDFLRKQEADVVLSCQSLEEIIQEIDKLMAKRFVDSFEEVRRAFQRMFHELFGGGEAELLLSDPDNPLTTGIEIMAQPPGKKLQNISLLSGGEKALTAIALLCATLEVKPTPFCLLDEIDASLDDANIRRFMRVISRLAQNTQFIIITHSKETMLAVDTLYGVTMPEQGVSQLIAVELTDEEDQ